MIKYTLITLMAVIAHSSYAQYFLESRITSLTVKQNDSLAFMGDTLLVDSLFLEDNATLLFQNNSYVIISNSFIGENAIISSAGSDGKNGARTSFRFSQGSDGKDGQSGKDLTLFIHFNEIGSLTITSEGGNGGRGGDGYYEGNSGIGGQGGSGGNLAVYYTYDSAITPKFNRPNAGPNSVLVKSDAGLCGSTGLANYQYKKKAWNPLTSNYKQGNRIIGNTRGRTRTNTRIPGWYSATSNRYRYGNEQPQTRECYSGDPGNIILKKVVYE